MTNPIDETQKLYEELQAISDQIESEMMLEQIAEQSIIELKSLEMQPMFDEYYGASVYSKMIEKSVSKPVYRDPKGGLTAAGRAYFRRKEGANLKPGVMGAANTPEKMRRKGSFLTRFFTNPSGPMKDEKGRATRLALSAAAWGEPVPQNVDDAKKLAAKGRRMLQRYQRTKDKTKSYSEFDIFNKTASENYYSNLDSEEMKGIFPTSGIFGYSDIDAEGELSLRIAARRELASLVPSLKSSMSYIPSDEDKAKRIASASKMMQKRRKQKNA